MTIEYIIEKIGEMPPIDRQSFVNRILSETGTEKLNYSSLVCQFQELLCNQEMLELENCDYSDTLDEYCETLGFDDLIEDLKDRENPDDEDY